METVRLSGWTAKKGGTLTWSPTTRRCVLWPVPFESRQVATRFGSTHVGDRDTTATGRTAGRGRQTAINGTYY
jgi:hypothetical protein